MSTNINIVNNFGPSTQLFNNTALGSLVPRTLPAEVTAPHSALGKFLKGFQSGFVKGFLDGFKGALTSPSCPCSPPVPGDSTHPSGSLKVDDKGVVTTPGGYKIEALKQYEWKITGPDGKETRIWGDPHVDLGNDGKTEFDFKRPTTFMLGDGTKIDVSVKPYGNMTVTSGLQIISGNDRVQVTDIDKGKGKTGQVTQDGFAHVNDFGKNDVLVMGKDVTQWSFNGKEVIGSENGGETFKLGNEIKPMLTVPQQNGGPEAWAQKLLQSVTDMLKHLMPQSQPTSPFPGHNPYAGGGLWEGVNGGGYNQQNHIEQLGNSFKAIAQMFQVLATLADLTQQLNRRPVYTVL